MESKEVKKLCCWYLSLSLSLYTLSTLSSVFEERSAFFYLFAISSDLQMEKESRGNFRPLRGAPEADFLLQWGNRKRPRCVKVRSAAGGTPPGRSEGQRRATSRVSRRVIRSDKDLPSPPTPALRRSESAGSENAKPRSDSASPDKEDRFYPTRGSVAAAGDENGCGGGGGGGGGEERGGAAATVMPRFFISLSNKEKEEDFLAMKGCKLPQRPKKRPKILQKSLLLVSPGAWLTDLSYERYEVREKRCSRKRRRGLKAMCLESDSE